MISTDWLFVDGYGSLKGRGNITFDNFVQACATIRSLTRAFQDFDVHRTGVIQINYEQVNRLIGPVGALLNVVMSLRTFFLSFVVLGACHFSAILNRKQILPSIQCRLRFYHRTHCHYSFILSLSFICPVYCSTIPLITLLYKCILSATTCSQQSCSASFVTCLHQRQIKCR